VHTPPSFCVPSSSILGALSTPKESRERKTFVAGITPYQALSKTRDVYPWVRRWYPVGASFGSTSKHQYEINKIAQVTRVAVAPQQSVQSYNKHTYRTERRAPYPKTTERYRI